MVPNQENRSVSAAAEPGNGSYMHAHIHTQCSLSCTQTTINNNHQYIVSYEARLPSPSRLLGPGPLQPSPLISYTSKLLHGCDTRKILVLVNRVICDCDTDSWLRGVLRLSRRTVSSTDTPLHQQPGAGWRNAHGRRTFKNKLPDMTASYKQLDIPSDTMPQFSGETWIANTSNEAYTLSTLQCKPVEITE